MKLACYIKKDRLKQDSTVNALLERLVAEGFTVYPVATSSEVEAGTDALLSLGGDGTFLSAAHIAVPAGVPIMGVNFGRLGFLSENKPEDVVSALKSGEYTIEERELLKVSINDGEESTFWPYALNEASVSRVSASMLGIDVEINGTALPTYWADGLLVATSSGSTAYALSIGGPICTPDSRVFIVAPISPHNLNLRPLIVPQSSVLRISLRSRDSSAVFTMDNRNYTIPASTCLQIEAAPLVLKRMCLGQSNFFNALRTRLFWGEDMRNGREL